MATTGTTRAERWANFSEEEKAERRARENARVKAANRKIREELLERLGHKCECCGECRYEFLAIDHINGGGNKHRGGLSPQTIYRQMRDDPDFEKKYRILCHNCNHAIGTYGYCPHALENQSAN